MRTAFRCFLFLCVVFPAPRTYGQRTVRRGAPLTFADCGSSAGPPARGAASIGNSLNTINSWGCAPPYESPAYVPPADDGVALGTLVEAAGYSGADTDGNVLVAAGNFCGGQSQKELILVANKITYLGGKPPHAARSANLSLLQGPTPNFLANVNPLPVGFVDPRGAWTAVAAGNLAAGQPYDQIVLVRTITSSNVPDLIVMQVSTVRAPPVQVPTSPIEELQDPPTSPASAQRTPGQGPSDSVPEVQERCGVSGVLASATIGSPSNSSWLGAVVGNFDGTGRKRIVLLRSGHPGLSLVEFDQDANNTPRLNVVETQDLDEDASHPSEWRVLAAGDIDHDGKDELIAARKVSDGASPTVLAFKWNGSQFVLFATSTFGNDGNSDWAGATAGDFNADGRQAVVLVKNKHSNFAVLDFPAGATALQVRTTSDLDSVGGQSWGGLAATDWIGGDQGAAELIAVRAVTRPYRTNVFVYGNPFLRVSRDTALQETKAQYVQHLLRIDPTNPTSGNYAYFTPTIDDLKSWLRGTHTNVLNWVLQVTQDSPFPVHDYSDLVNFLSQTRNWGVDGKQLRVWVSLVPPKGTLIADPLAEGCATPEDTRPVTDWDARDYFKRDYTHDYEHLSDQDKIAACKDLIAWAAVLGRLAQDFPQLVAVGIDDFSDGLDQQSSPDCYGELEFRLQFNENCIATIESKMRAQAPWLNFVPTVYYDYFQNRLSRSKKDWADLGLTLDSMQFFFRNEKKGECIDRSQDCERTVNNAPDEIRDMAQLLPNGRKLEVGMYFGGCGACSEHANQSDKFTPVQVRYDYDLARIALDMPAVGGATAYPLQTPPWICTGTCNPNDPQYHQNWQPCTGSQCVPVCTDFNFLNDTSPPGDSSDGGFYEMWGSDRYCALQKAYGDKPEIVTDSDLTATGPAAASDPSAYFDPVQGTHHVIYRSSDGHLHELWWTSGPLGQGDLTPHGPAATNDPASYFLAGDGTNHVIFRGQDSHVHELWWTGPAPPSQGDLTPNGPAAVGDPSAYFFAGDGTQQVIYRDANGHLHELWWVGSAPPGQGDLTPHGPAAAGNTSFYFDPADGTLQVIYRGLDNHVHELWWAGSAPPGQGDLTPNGPSAASDPSGYFAAPDNTQHVIYRSSYNQLRELWWIGAGAVGQDEITTPEVASPADGNPSAYFETSDGSNHVIYRSQDGHIHELLWHAGTVTQTDLTALVGAPNAAGNPAAYYFAEEHMHHVFYRSTDGHVHELRWSN